MDTAQDLIEAFLDGARTGVAPGLYIEGQVLYLSGYWQAAFRLSDEACIVQAEPPPEPTDVIDRLEAALRRRGLQPIPGDHPLVQAVTYAELSIVAVAWTLWATDADTGQAALAQRTGSQPAPEVGESGSAPSVWDHPALGDFSAEFAKSAADGLPAARILAVGLGAGVAAELEAVVGDCRVQAAGLDEAVAACAVTVPHLVIVDADTDDGLRFLLEYRAEACGRHTPVAAVTGGDAPTGADLTLDPRQPAATWGEQLRAVLP